MGSLDFVIGQDGSTKSKTTQKLAYTGFPVAKETCYVYSKLYMVNSLRMEHKSYAAETEDEG